MFAKSGQKNWTRYIFYDFLLGKTSLLTGLPSFAFLKLGRKTTFFNLFCIKNGLFEVFLR